MHCSDSCSACMGSAMSTRTSGCWGRRAGYPRRQSYGDQRRALHGRIRTEWRRGDEDRLQAWREWLNEAWSSNQDTVYRGLKGDTYAPPVTFLVRTDGTATTNLWEMDSLLQAARRQRPINRKYAEAAEPDPADFLHRYGYRVTCVRPWSRDPSPGAAYGGPSRRCTPRL